MHVIRHQAIADQTHPVDFYVLAQKIEIYLAVSIAIQDESPALPRWVTWCGTSTAMTRAKRATMKTLPDTP